MKIFQLIHHLRTGGAERMFSMLLPALRDAGGFEVYAGVLDSGGELETGIERHNIPLYRFNKQELTGPVISCRLNRILKELRIDILHMHEFSAGLWGRLASIGSGVKAKLITDHAVAGWKNPTKHSIINRLLSPLTDKIVALSAAAQDSLIAVEGIPQEKIIVIPNGIDFSPFEKPVDRAVQRARLGIRENETCIGMVGRHSHEKGGDVLLEALALLRHVSSARFKAVLVGDGDQRSGWELLAQRLGLSQHTLFTGTVEHGALHAYFSCFDIGVIPSRQENCSVALIELMACGIPVIATNAGGNSEILLDKQCGLIAEINAPADLAKKLILYIEHEEMRRVFAENARRRSHDFYSIKTMAERYIEVYRGLVTS